ncbi:ataxia telangiectasia and Rad3 related, isoform CRA_a [Cladochytrium replicatum]|nr:ataxia telangiectasia and Rad3 related, isoform CRA_a [Cladochytrium replicatum]
MLGILSHYNTILISNTETIEEKIRIVSSLGKIVELIGQPVSFVTLQILTTLQTALEIDVLRTAALNSWNLFIRTLLPQDIVPVLSRLVVVVADLHERCTAYQLQLIVGTLEYLLLELGPKLGPDYYELPLLPNVVEFQHINRQIQENRNSHGVLEIICLLLPGVMNENSAVVKQSLHEMIKVLQENCEFLNEHVLEESINSCIPLLIKHLLETCSRFNGSSLDIQLLCAKCLGVLGAVDPGRLEFTRDEERLLVLDNNSSPEDSLSFVCVLIEKQLVPAFRSAPSTKVQDKIALTLQELLKTFGFDSKLISGHLSIGNKDPRKSILQKWQAFPKSVQEVIQPFLESKYGIQEANTGQSKLSSPLYPKRANYKEWIQMWALDLINRLPESIPKKVFALCGRLIKGADANISIVLFILPHIILNVLLAGSEDDQQDLLVEVTTVLTDSSLSDIGAREKREFACQTIFILVDHLTKYMRHRRLSLAKRQVKKSVKVDDSHNVTVIRACKIVEHFLAQIPQDIMAQASYRCKAYERAVMHFEQHMRHQGAIAPGWWSSTIQSDNDAESYKLPSSQNLYSHLQQIYSNIDDPDGMSGIAAMFRNPTIEQQILEHESSGNWSAMQTCFEILLKNDPTNLKHHIGLIRCLKNLGHFETMINHVNGAIVTHPDWKKYLAGYAIEASWRLAHWDDIEHFLQISHEENFEVSLGQLLLAGQKLDVLSFNNTLRKVRASLMAPLAAASMESYQRCYDHIRKLHMLSEIESVFEVQQDPKDVEENAKRLFATWELRLKSTVASFRVREPILNLRRVLLAQMIKGKRRVIDECGKNWLQAAKVARKAGYIQTAFSAIMHAEEMHSGQAHIERAKWHWTNREFRKGISELQSALETSFAVTADDGNPSAANGSMSTLHIRAKTNLLLARWMDEKCMGNPSALQQKYKSVIEDQAEWEKGHYYLGRFYNKLYETEKKNTTSQRALGPSYALFVCKSYAQSLTYGTRFIYNTLPRLLTIWMDLGTTKVKRFMEMNKTVKRLITKLPTYYFLTTFPQIVSRICHPNDSLYTSLERIMIQVMTVYPQHALWHLISVYRSTYKFRSARCSAVFSKVKVILEAMKLTEQLLILCNHQISSRDPSLSMSATFKVLSKMQKLSMIIPLQSNMTVTLPLSSLSHSFESHNPFPNNMPRIEGFRDEIEVMQSLQKPRKITVIGSDGNDYIFLCKPKDDLRKDTRLMEFNSLINKLLKKSAESRKRSLHIRTYAVIPLNEECGLIEWVNNTVGFRNVLVKSYKSKGIYMLPQEAKQVSDRKDLPPAEIFVKHLLPRHPPVFHEWFVETFPEPTRWFASRRAYSTTTAVISMVGHILGLGDRHGENILFDELTGETVHVDFNCLFEKGLTFEKPEKVPFRLTHNMVNAFGVTGVEGVFRNACEATMRVLHLNQELLMTVLETFIYDPLCEWSKRKGGTVSEDRGEVQNEQALRSLNTIKRKLEGWVGQVPYSVEGQVHELINQAMEVQNLSVMYIGWAAFM